MGVETSRRVDWEKQTLGFQRWEVLGVGPRGSLEKEAQVGWRS